MAILMPCNVCERDVASDIDGPCPYCKTNDPVGRIARQRRDARIFGALMILVVSGLLGWMYFSGKFPPIIYKLIKHAG